MKALDLFCGAGGAAMGLHRAGFDVTGIDIKPQLRYPFRFIQADALKPPVNLSGFDLIWASPPCQDHVRSPGPAPKHGTGYMLDAMRSALKTSGRAWVIENVPGAPMRVDYKLCGCQFNLPELRRERWFETSWHGFSLMPSCHHNEPAISVTGTGTPTGTWRAYGSLPLSAFQRAMGIGWMRRAELSQAIPPAYSEFIGRAALQYIEAA